METILAWSKCSAVLYYWCCCHFFLVALAVPAWSCCPVPGVPCMEVDWQFHRVSLVCVVFFGCPRRGPSFVLSFALLCLESGMNIWLTFPLLLLCFYCGTEYKRNVRVKLNEWKVKCFHSCKQTRNIFERELNLPSIGPNTHTYVISNRRWWNVISWSTLRCESFYATFDLILLPCMISFAKTWTRF